MEIFSALLALCEGHRWIPLTKPVTRSCDVFFDLRLNKQLGKQWRRWLFETPLRSLWHRCKVSRLTLSRLPGALNIFACDSQSFLDLVHTHFSRLVPRKCRLQVGYMNISNILLAMNVFVIRDWNVLECLFKNSKSYCASKNVLNRIWWLCKSTLVE